MKFTKEMVNELADKLLIGLSDEECENVLNEFVEIAENLNLINKLDLTDVEAYTHCLENFSYELREDEIVSSDNIEDILSNAGDAFGREIKIPKVVNKDAN